MDKWLDRGDEIGVHVRQRRRRRSETVSLNGISHRVISLTERLARLLALSRIRIRVQRRRWRMIFITAYTARRHKAFGVGRSGGRLAGRLAVGGAESRDQIERASQ